MRKTKIVATLGPASDSSQAIRTLIARGVNVFRLNFSHGSQEEHARRIARIRAAARALDVTVGILADLQGPKIRTGLTEGDRPVLLRKGTRVTVVPGSAVCSASVISIDYPRLAREVTAGQSIMLNDGAVALRVESVDRRRGELRCAVLNDGSYASRKGVNLPNTSLKVPSLTRKDHRDLRFALDHDVNFVALSFVRTAADLAPVRAAITGSRKPVKLIAKIEKPEAAASIDAILDACDGIMVARGDLGVETSPADVTVLQKRLISSANAKGKLVIVATQMLESMMGSPRPTRAEASDVANAILDGADALMLSGETAVGTYPAESVAMMAEIAVTTELSDSYRQEMVDLALGERHPAHALCEAAAWASHDLDGAPVIALTMTGATALYLSKIRNQAPIVALSPDKGVVSMLNLAWNVLPLCLPFHRNIGALQRHAEKLLLRRKVVGRGDLVLVLGGTTPVEGATNSLRVKRVGE